MRSIPLISRAASRSSLRPTITHATPASISRDASSAYRFGDHRFAWPNAAPGAIPTRGCPDRHPRSSEQRHRGGTGRGGRFHLRRQRAGFDAEVTHEIRIVLGKTDAAPRLRHRSRQQRPAEVAAITPPFLDAGLPQYPRRAERIREKDADISTKLRRLVPAIEHEDAIDIRNRAKNRRDGWPRRNSHRLPRKVTAHVAKRRQRHNRVAQPVGREYEYFHSLIPNPKVRQV